MRKSFKKKNIPYSPYDRKPMKYGFAIATYNLKTGEEVVSSVVLEGTDTKNVWSEALDIGRNKITKEIMLKTVDLRFIMPK